MSYRIVLLCGYNSIQLKKPIRHEKRCYSEWDQKPTCLCLLDLSAAFDTIVHDILITRHSSWVGIHGSVLSWFKSYLSSRCFRGVRYAGFTPRPVNQAGAQGEEAGREIANGGARQRRRWGKMHKRSAYRVAGSLWNDKCKKLNSLKHLVRTTVAGSHN